MQPRVPLPRLPGPPHPAKQGKQPAPADLDIDLERIVYDPVYRRNVRDQLNRARRAGPAGGKD